MTQLPATAGDQTQSPKGPFQSYVLLTIFHTITERRAETWLPFLDSFGNASLRRPHGEEKLFTESKSDQE